MRFPFAAVFFSFACAASAHAAPAALNVTLKGLLDDGHISPKHAYCAIAANGKSGDGGNVSPEISWSKGPDATRSYAIIMHDPDVPAKFDDANQEGKTLPAKMPRQDFIHWVLVDIAPEVLRLTEGADSDRVDHQGKRDATTKYGVRGVNDYGHFFKGVFYGYDGPCPPWNDERWHHYTFTVYALDVPSLKLKGAFTAKDAEQAMKGHVLAKGQAVGQYTQNTALTVKGAK